MLLMRRLISEQLLMSHGHAAVGALWESRAAPSLSDPGLDGGKAELKGERKVDRCS